MARKVGDRIISKRADGRYDILQISGAREIVSADIATLDEARRIARDGLHEEGQVWYRDHQDAPDHLEPL